MFAELEQFVSKLTNEEIVYLLYKNHFNTPPKTTPVKKNSPLKKKLPKRL